MGYQPKDIGIPAPAPPAARIPKVRLPDFAEHFAMLELAECLGIPLTELADDLGFSPYEVDERLYDSHGRYVEDRPMREMVIRPSLCTSRMIPRPRVLPPAGGGTTMIK